MSWKSTIQLFPDGHIYTEPDFVENPGGSMEDCLKIGLDYNFNDDCDFVDFTADSETGKYLLTAIKFYEKHKDKIK